MPRGELLFNRGGSEKPHTLSGLVLKSDVESLQEAADTMSLECSVTRGPARAQSVLGTNIDVSEFRAYVVIKLPREEDRIVYEKTRHELANRKSTNR